MEIILQSSNNSEKRVSCCKDRFLYRRERPPTGFEKISVFKRPRWGEVLTGEDNVLAAPAELAYECRRYYWRVDADYADGSVAPGHVWSFSQAPK